MVPFCQSRLSANVPSYLGNGAKYNFIHCELLTESCIQAFDLGWINVSFCCHFVYRCRPFYRTEMLIITAKNDAQWRHKTAFDDKVYGAVLRKDFLHKVQFIDFYFIVVPY